MPEKNESRRKEKTKKNFYKEIKRDSIIVRTQSIVLRTSQELL